MNRNRVIVRALLGFSVVLAFGIGQLSAGGPPSVPEVPAAPAKVVLINPGAEPRQPLRLQVKSGDAVALDMKMTLSTATAGMPSPAMPPMLTAMDFTVAKVTAEGDVKTWFECTKGEVG